MARTVMFAVVFALVVVSASAQHQYLPFQPVQRPRAMMCGSQAIDLTKFVCCDGRTPVELPQNIPYQFASCCEQEVIDTRSDGCCKHGTNQERYQVREQGCCGPELYDLQGGESCCAVPARNFYQVIEQNELCCGPRVVDASNYICCQDKANQVSDPQNYICCGTKAVERRKYQCCGNGYVRIGSQSTKCCNGTVYKTGSSSCCTLKWGEPEIGLVRGRHCPKLEPPTTPPPPTTTPPPTTPAPTTTPKPAPVTTESKKAQAPAAGGAGTGQVNVVIHPVPGMPNLALPYFNFPFQRPGAPGQPNQRMWFPFPGLIPGFPRRGMPGIFPGMPGQYPGVPHQQMPGVGFPGVPNQPVSNPGAGAGVPRQGGHAHPRPSAAPIYPGLPKQQPLPRNPHHGVPHRYPGMPHHGVAYPGVHTPKHGYPGHPQPPNQQPIPAVPRHGAQLPNIQPTPGRIPALPHQFPSLPVNPNKPPGLPQAPAPRYGYAPAQPKAPQPQPQVPRQPQMPGFPWRQPQPRKPAPVKQPRPGMVYFKKNKKK